MAACSTTSWSRISATICSWWSTRPARPRTRRICGRILSDSCIIDSLADRALIALQGPKAEGALAKLGADVVGHEVHGFRPAPRRRLRLLRVALRLHRRGRFRDFGAGCRCRSAGDKASRKSRCAADRARRARQPAARGRALPLRSRHRHHDHAGGSRAGMVGAEEPPQWRRARRRFSGRGKNSRAARQRRFAPPRRPEGRRPRAGARRRGAVCR